jgi:hypothetical protein
MKKREPNARKTHDWCSTTATKIKDIKLARSDLHCHSGMFRYIYHHLQYLFPTKAQFVDEPSKEELS